ncbi:type I glyceraldehyde-3-phosphate dehydrogenase [Candidatus Dependentiae bacterium]
MKTMRVALNGFGRIGRTFLRTLFQDKEALEKIEVPVINMGPAPIEGAWRLFQYDSVMGKFPGKVEQDGKALYINDRMIILTQKMDAANLPWYNYGITWVVDATGKYTKKADAEQHLDAGALRVLITAPSDNCDITIIPGVNGEKYDRDKHFIVSLGSCTTNCFAPIMKIVAENLEFKYGQMTTVHAYTNDQALLDGSHHSDPRRGRAAAVNIIPTSTGTAKVIGQIFPDLKLNISCRAIRVPVPKVSLVDFSFVTEKKYTPIDINNLFKRVSQGKFSEIIGYSDIPLVSSDFSMRPESTIVDGTLTQTAQNMAKIIAWYDNEYGYCMRLKEFLLHRGLHIN